MKNWTTLPHEKLIAYQAARQLLALVREARISNPRIREQALNAASSACLNIAEATGRSGSADQKRVYAIARGEVCEAAAALDIAALAGGCAADTTVAGAAAPVGSMPCLAGSSASRRYTQRKPKRKPPNENDKPKRKPQTKTVLVARSRWSGPVGRGG
jgi:four helix bundle protein